MSLVNPEGAEPVVAIIGSGFSGTMVAVHLAQRAGPSPLKILLIEKGPRFARGLAYDARSDRHLLNVPAGLMSAFPDEPSHFLDWLQSRITGAHSGIFAPRKLYGDYLEELLTSTAHASAVPIELVRDEVIDLRQECPSDDSRFSLRTASGRLIVADRIVLATGNPAPLQPTGFEQSAATGRYVASPWASSPLEGVEPEDSIALIGSGLTAVDIVVESNERGHRGIIYTISRHGLLPNPHRPTTPRPHFQLMGQRPTARSLLRSVRTEAVQCQAEGGDWRSVVDAIRPAAQTLWRSLAGGERQRFIRHLAAHWDVHRHRVAPEIDDLLKAMLLEGRLVVVAGRVVAWEGHANHIVLKLQRRGQTGTQSLPVGRVINCTGPARDVRLSDSKLLQSLLVNRIGRPGPLALGLEVADSGALVAPDGRVHNRIFAIGPLLKERLWETTAIRELRCQAAELARQLLPLLDQ